MKKKKRKNEPNTQLKNKVNADLDINIKTFRDIGSFIKRNKLYLIIFFIFTWIIYANIVTGDFVNLDDYSKILTGPEYYNLSESLKSLDLYRIIMTLFIKAFGVNSSALHVLAIFSHILNGIFVFFLIHILFGKKFATLGTLMFLSHPANTEVLSWHAGYPYALRANIIIPTLIFFALFKKSKNKIFLYMSGLLYTFALVFLRGGGWVLITPFLVVLMDQFILEEKVEFKNIVQYLPYLVPSLVFAVVLIPTFLKGRVESLETLYYVDTETATPLLNRIPYTIYMQYKTLFYPINLSIYHEGKYITPVEYTFMIFITIGVIFGIFYFWKKNRAISGLMLMIIFSILPSFSPVIVAWIAAERYQYIASIFSSIIIITSLVWFDKKILKNRRWDEKTISKFVLYSSIVIITLYSVRTVFRNNDLRNSKNLWTASKKTAPYSYRVYNNMGDVLANEGDLDGALENFKRSVALKPDYADAVHNIGHIYMVKKDYVRAIKYLEQSLQMNPRLYPSAYKLGVIHTEKNDLEKAKKYFEQCLSIDPNNADCINGLQNVTSVVSK